MSVLTLPTHAAQTVRHALALRAAGMGMRRMRMPKQIYPKTLEAEYARALVGVLEAARPALAPLFHELPALLARANAERRGDRTDVGEAERARKIIESARLQLEQRMPQPEIESLARLFGKRTQTYQRVQLGRQVRAALGADVLAEGSRISTLLDHFVQENAALIRTIPHDFITEIDKHVTRAFTNATPNAQLAEELQERFDISERHARLIARDQIGKLYGQTNAVRQQEVGIESFIWRTAGDERVRDEHEALNGQEFRFDDPPDEGLPGEPIQCRCYAEPVIAPLRAAVSEAEDEET